MPQLHPATRSASQIKFARGATGEAVIIAIFAKARLRLIGTKPKCQKDHRQDCGQYSDQGLHFARLTYHFD